MRPEIVGAVLARDTDFGGFLGQTLDLMGANARAVVLFVLVLGGFNATGLMLGLIDGSDTIAGLGFGFNIDAEEGLIAGLFQIASGALTFIASYFLLMELLASCGRLPDRSTRIWAYIGMGILSMLGMVLGFLLLIIPGVILMVRWSASSGFLIADRMGISQSLGASWDATRGHSWPIFFAGVVLFIGLAIIGGVLGGLAGFAGNDLLIAVVSSMAEATGTALGLAFGIGVFTLVHDNSSQIGEVFA